VSLPVDQNYSGEMVNAYVDKFLKFEKSVNSKLALKLAQAEQRASEEETQREILSTAYQEKERDLLTVSQSYVALQSELESAKTRISELEKQVLLSGSVDQSQPNEKPPTALAV